MNVRIFWVRAKKCMCAQTRPRFILSSERVCVCVCVGGGGVEFEPMLTPRETSPLPENFPEEDRNGWLDKPSIMKRYHRRVSWSVTIVDERRGVTSRLPTMVTLHDTRFVECRWWNDGWTAKTVVTWPSSASMIPAPGPPRSPPSLVWWKSVRLESCTLGFFCVLQLGLWGSPFWVRLLRVAVF